MRAEQLMLTEVAEAQEQAANQEYQAFIDKFKPKLTTDDCYTPPLVYDAVADWVAAEYHLDRAQFVRPFYPGGDYQRFAYPEGCVVVDNPPFSLYAQICKYYQAEGIPFFIFGPSLTAFSARNVTGICFIIADADITYENGANVMTAFATNLDACKVRSAPSLYQAVKAANDANLKAQKVELPKYAYPDEVLTAAMVQRYSRYGVDFRIYPEECQQIGAMDVQREQGKGIFGSGLLLSERAAAERAAAERARAIRWQLSEREREICQRLQNHEQMKEA